MRLGRLLAISALLVILVAAWTLTDAPSMSPSAGREAVGPQQTVGPVTASSYAKTARNDDPVIEDFQGSAFAKRRAADEIAAAQASNEARVIAAGALALWRCAQAIPGLSTPTVAASESNEKLLARQRQARATLEAYCSGIDYGESMHRDLLALQEKGSRYGASLTQAMLLAKQPHLRTPDRLCAVAVGSRLEPEILRHLGSILPTLPNQRILDQRYDPNTDQLIYRAALEIAACRAGAECTAKSWNVLRACAADGHCKDDDVIDGLFKALETDAQRTRVDTLSTRIVHAIDEKQCFFSFN
jgi:hypothetical protein